jgi:hypothetical protein
MTDNLTFMNTRKLLNQRKKTQLGGKNNVQPDRLGNNIMRNQQLSREMNRKALKELSNYERRAPEAYRSIKQDFYEVSRKMYDLADAIRTVDKTINSNGPNTNGIFQVTNSNKQNTTNKKQQRKMMRDVKDNYFQVSRGLVTLSESIKNAGKTIPGINGPSPATNMTNYIRGVPSKSKSKSNKSVIPNKRQEISEKKFGLFNTVSRKFGLFSK